MRKMLAALLVCFAMSGCNCGVVEPGHIGVKVVAGKIAEGEVIQGFWMSWPFMSHVVEYSTKQFAVPYDTECFSSDLQQVDIKTTVYVKIPPKYVSNIYRDYNGADAFTTLVQPRLHEAIKEATSGRTAEMIVHERQKVKTEALALLKTKVGDIIEVDDVVIVDISLSKDLVAAIDNKMVQQQVAEKAKYTKQQAETDAETLGIQATAEANAIKIKSAALATSPQYLQLKMIEKWSGKAPDIVSGQSGLNLLLPALAK